MSGLLACVLFASLLSGAGRAPQRKATPAERLPKVLARLVAEAEARSVRTGVWVASPDSRSPIYMHRAGEAFVPASNMKLFTAALVLELLGPEHRFETRFYLQDTAKGPALRIESDGDPCLAGRFLGEKKHFDELVTALAKAGVEALPGGILLDDRDWPGPARPAGWNPREFTKTYAPQTGAFVLDEGTIGVTVDPAGRSQGACEIRLKPAHLKLPIRGAIRLTGDRKKGSRPIVALDAKGVRLEGLFYRRAGAATYRFAARDAKAVYARVLEASLRAGGIQPGPFAETVPPRPEGATLLLARKTPLSLALERMLRNSSNFQAEQCLRVAAWKQGGTGSLEAGRALLEAHFAPPDGERQAWKVADGSGLARANRLSPRLIARLLGRVRDSSYYAVYRNALARGGVSGTLRSRFRGSLRGAVSAKTGTLRGATSLSGYVRCKSGQSLIFSILMNYDPERRGKLRSELRALQDRIVEQVFAAL
ncbi:MAG: D-alanyl-D-alanine carboxypeptidase/D-alanyl-D-alanine-endopeptidase [Planctomycetota bacterium]